MRAPAALPAVSLVAGVCLGAALPGSAFVRAVLAVLVVLAWVTAVAALWRRPTVLAAAAAVGFLAAGGLLGLRAVDVALHPSLRMEMARRGLLDRPSGSPPDPVWIEGTLRRDASRTASGVSLSVAVQRVRFESGWQPAEGGVQVTVAGETATARMGAWRAGRRVRFPSALRRPARYLNPGTPDGERALALRGTTLVGSVKSALVVEVLARGGWLAEQSAAGRHRVREAIRRTVATWSERSAGIVTAILIGDRAGLDADVERRLQDAGTYHVIAISGGNIAILAGTLFAVLSAAGIRGRAAALAAIVALAAYAEFVGGGPSVIRATAMAIAYLVARLGDLRTTAYNALGAAAAPLVCASPTTVFDPGLALTFGATLGILIGTGHLTAAAVRRRWIGIPLLLFVASVSAELAVFPVGARAFSRITAAGVVLNFFAVPLMTVLQLAGLAAVTLELIGRIGLSLSAPAAAAGYVAHAAAMGLVESARLVDAAPWVARRLAAPSLIAVGGYYAGIVVCLASLHQRRAKGTSGRGWRHASTGAAAVAAGAAAWMVAAPPLGRDGARDLVVTFVDVGQGDAVLVRFPGGRRLLVDAGGAPGAADFDFGGRVLVPALWGQGIRRLDYLALTHAHPDHIGGAEPVLRVFDPPEVWEGIAVPGHAPSDHLRTLAAARGSAWRRVSQGSALVIGGVELEVLHPPPPDWERPRVRNDDSIVLELRYGGVSVLLTGDVGAEVEASIAARLRPSPFRALKVAHHGSRGSTTEAFVEAAGAAVAVVSAGRDNRYGHPAPEVLARLERSGARIFRTDTDGAVMLTTDGRQVVVETYDGSRTAWKREGITPRP